jgi:hypothetical protein
VHQGVPDDLVECCVTANVLTAEDMFALCHKGCVNASGIPPVKRASLHLLSQILNPRS